jgi:anti-sigma B factor antagonist
MNKDDFYVSKEKDEEGVTRITVKGQINAINSTALQYELEEAFNKGEKNILLNMMQVEFLCSSGIRVILKAYKTAKNNDGQFQIERPSEIVRNVLGITALDSLLLK